MTLKIKSVEIRTQGLQFWHNLYIELNENLFTGFPAYELVRIGFVNFIITGFKSSIYDNLCGSPYIQYIYIACPTARYLSFSCSRKLKKIKLSKFKDVSKFQIQAGNSFYPSVHIVITDQTS